MGVRVGGRGSRAGKKLKNPGQKFKKRTPHGEYESISFRVRSREMGILPNTPVHLNVAKIV